MGTGESIPATLRLILVGPTAVREATAAARELAAAASLQKALAARLAIAVEELVTNLYEHAQLNHEDQVEVRLSRKEDLIAVTIIDPGRPFDPRLISHDGTIPERGGGAGLALVRSWASEIRYSSNAGYNRLEVSLPITG